MSAHPVISAEKSQSQIKEVARLRSGFSILHLLPRAEAVVPPAPGNCSRQPLLWAALAYAAGIGAGSQVWRPLSIWLSAAVVFLAASAYFRRRRVRFGFVLGLAAFGVLGALAIQLRRTKVDFDPTALTFADGREVLVAAHVVGEGEVRAGGSRGGIRQRIDVETESMETDGRVVPVRAGLRLTVYGKGELPESGVGYSDSEPGTTRIFRYGERLRFPAKLRPPRNFRNPGAFDYTGYLADNGITLLGSARMDRIESLPGFAGTRVEVWRSRVHRSILSKIHAVWAPREAALLDAVVLGESAFLENESRVDFQRSGTYHVLVVSGMNVGILAYVVFWAMRRLRLSELMAGVLTVWLSFAYAYVTQVGPPVWRAVLMLTIYLGVRLLYRDRSMLNAWGAAALGVMVFDPKAVLGASFQLTFLAVLIIAAIGVPLLERTSQPYIKGLRSLESADYDRKLAPSVAQFRLDLRLVAERVARFPGGGIGLRAMRASAHAGLSAYEILSVAAVMQLGLVLPMAYYFHRATVIGLPANVVALPLTGVLMPAAAAAVGLSYVAVPLAKIPAWAAAMALHGITGSVHWLGGFRIADHRVPTPEWSAIVIGVVALAAAMALARRRAVLAGAGIVFLACVAIWISAKQPIPKIDKGKIEITAIDVGEGDSLLLVSPEGKLLLIDAGGPSGGQQTEFDYGENVVSPYLWSRGIGRLDAVVLTHGHSDHMGGMRAVLNNFRPQELWIGGLPSTPQTDELLEQAQHLAVRVVQKGGGEEFDLDGMRVRVLAPPRDWTSGSQPRNNDSLVLHVRYGETSALLEGDAEKVVEGRMAAEENLRADVLKVGHHGSATSTSPALLAGVQPKWAVISLGWRNTYGFPRMEVLARLQAAGARTYRTDLQGAVSFYLDGRTVSARSASLH